VFMNTFVAAAVSLLVWLFTDWIADGKPTAFGSALSVVVGLVAITPAAGFVTLDAAMVIGALAAIVCNFSIRFLKARTLLDDSLDVFACHGIGGLIGSLLTGLFASQEVNSSIVSEGWLISGDTHLMMVNLYSALIVAGFSLIVTYLIIKFVSVFTPIRVDAAEEAMGLDQALHGEMARFHQR